MGDQNAHMQVFWVVTRPLCDTGGYAELRARAGKRWACGPRCPKKLARGHGSPLRDFGSFL